MKYEKSLKKHHLLIIVRDLTQQHSPAAVLSEPKRKSCF